MAEDVLIVPRVELFVAERDAFQGYRDAAEFPELASALARRVAKASTFLPRDEVEEDPTLKQIIPYGLVTFERPDSSVEVFLMRRTKGGGEARLHDLYSVGVGGHINPVDEGTGRSATPESESTASFAGVVDAALHREISEELEVDPDYSIDVLGFINDDSNTVGAVHFGVVYRIEVDAPDVRVREVEHLEGRFVTSSVLAAHADRMESWSQLLVESIRAEILR